MKGYSVFSIQYCVLCIHHEVCAVAIWKTDSRGLESIELKCNKQQQMYHVQLDLRMYGCVGDDDDIWLSQF